MTQQASENEALIAVMHKLQPAAIHKLTTPEGTEITVAEVAEGAGGRRLHSVKHLMEEYRKNPERRTGTAKHYTLQSFVDHTNRFKSKQSALFAKPDIKAPVLTVVFDYHDAGHEGQPRNCKHTGEFKFPVSLPWTEWLATNDTEMEMEDFADFLEKHIFHLVDPAALDSETRALLTDSLGMKIGKPSDVLSASKEFKVNVDRRAHQAFDRTTGANVISFSEEYKDPSTGAKVTFPNAFLIKIPVFQGGEFLVIGVQLNYRIREGVIKFSYRMLDVDRKFEHAFLESVTKAKDQTELPLFFATPEA